MRRGEQREREIQLRFLLIATLLALTSLGVAQVDPEAAQWLERAAEAHGGDAFRELSTVQEEGVITYYDPTGTPVQENEARTVIDLEGERMRMEMYVMGQLLVLQQVTPEGSFAYAFPQGELPLSEAETAELRMAFETGFYGLRLGAEGAQSASYLGEQEWGDVSGHAVEVSRNDNRFSYLLDDDGQLLADRYVTAQLGETTTFYTEFEEVDGILLPTEYESFAMGMKILSSQANDQVVNEPLAEDAFSVEEYREASEAARQVAPEILTWLQANVHPLESVDAGAPVADLQPFGEIVGDARVVALGEQTHGTSEFFRMKHRAFEYLVEEKGFTIFAIEANMPEARRLNEYVLTGEGDPAELLAGLYFWTWNTQEVLDMIEWMREYNETAPQPVQFTGFDMQFPDVAVENVREFLEEHDPALLEEYDGDLKAATSSSSLVSQAAPADEDLAGRIESLIADMEARQDQYEEAVGAQEAAWAIQNARVAFQAVGLTRGGVPWRDLAMAQNTLWLLDQYPDEKMMVWAHNGHVAEAEGWMGEHLAEALGDDYLSVAFSFEEGEYTAVNQQAGEVTSNSAGPAREGSVDALFAQVGPDAFVLDLRTAEGSPAAPWLYESRPFRSIGALAIPDASAFPSTVVAEDFDAVIFIRESTASQQLN